MRFGIRVKQVLGVVAIVGLAIAALGGWYIASLASILLQSSRSQAKIIANTMFQRTFSMAAQGIDVKASLMTDDGLRSILESVAYSDFLIHAVITDPNRIIIADADKAQIGKTLPEAPSVDDLIYNQGFVAQLRAIYAEGGQNFEYSEPIAVGSTDLGSIRVGVSTLLVRQQLAERMLTPLIAAAVVLGASIVVAVLLAQLVLRPIHVIRGGLARLGRGEVDVSVELPPDTELGDLGASFKQLTARLAAEQTERADQRALESVVDQLEDAVALFGTDRRLRFANAAMRTALGLDPAAPGEETDATDAPGLAALLPADHPYRLAVERALASEGTMVTAPVQVQVPDAGERLVLTNVVPGPDGKPMGVLLVSRNIAYISQVESTLSYSRKLAALNRLTAGIAHEIKNPLNATMIHLELLKMQVADLPDAMASAGVIADQVRRLDEVVQGFLKFTRPDELHLEAVDVAQIFERMRPVLDAEAASHKIDVRIVVPASLPAVEGDARLLEQAFLNLALNACQAMPNGGRLTLSVRESGRFVEVTVEDTGVGIPPEQLPRIFDLYFTTKPAGSGIGLSLVFRTIQLHNGDIDVQSIPGSGTTFTIHLRQAARMFQGVGQ
jgi:signal transduction histidine kinase